MMRRVCNFVVFGLLVTATGFGIYDAMCHTHVSRPSGFLWMITTMALWVGCASNRVPNALEMGAHGKSYMRNGFMALAAVCSAVAIVATFYMIIANYPPRAWELIGFSWMLAAACTLVEYVFSYRFNT